MKKKLISLLCVASLLIGLLAGCGSSGSAQTANGAKPAADKDVSSYVITGQDSEKASVQYVIDGKQSMTVFKDTRTLAADSVAMAMSILNGETPKTDTTYNNGVKDVPAKQTDIVVVTKSNVKEALIDSEYYDASDFTGL